MKTVARAISSPMDAQLEDTPKARVREQEDGSQPERFNCSVMNLSLGSACFCTTAEKTGLTNSPDRAVSC
jgi:hypothetical protein